MPPEEKYPNGYGVSPIVNIYASYQRSQWLRRWSTELMVDYFTAMAIQGAWGERDTRNKKPY